MDGRRAAPCTRAQAAAALDAHLEFERRKLQVLCALETLARGGAAVAPGAVARRTGLALADVKACLHALRREMPARATTSCDIYPLWECIAPGGTS